MMTGSRSASVAVFVSVVMALTIPACSNQSPEDNYASCAAKLSDLRQEMEQAQARHEQLKKDYNDYSGNVVSPSFNEVIAAADESTNRGRAYSNAMSECLGSD